MPVAEQNKDLGKSGTDVHCIGFQELKIWQVRQYRRAVDEHRLRLLREFGRNVAWKEAETEFSNSDLATMGGKWRVEYCGLICPFRNSCPLALLFLHPSETLPLEKAG